MPLLALKAKMMDEAAVHLDAGIVQPGRLAVKESLEQAGLCGKRVLATRAAALGADAVNAAAIERL
ncbi:hypothetical protein KTAU_34760 [Thermogemmatispora aurantia]|uniref:Uncharacterized protein n=1 Tax=Thermogemmatispora aurantia TaxID=2045279 RepID=A0A5J4KE40_9CHLR|nr:hypothetical protein KTAU_34760 [Thermogemmatispora aurantia]